jgi:hypothetical protein
MSQRFRTTVGALACLALGSGVSGLGASAFAHEVPNEANWHILDGTGPGPFAGSHHAPLAFFPALFAQEGLVYGTAEAPYVRCPNATNKGLLPHGAHGCLIRCLKRAPTAPDLAPPRPASPRAISQTCRESGDPVRGGPMPHTQQVARSNKPGDPSLKSPSAAIPRLNTRQHRNWVTEDAPRCAGWPVPRLWAVSRQAQARAAGGRVAPPAPGATAWLRRAA